MKTGSETARDTSSLRTNIYLAPVSIILILLAASILPMPAVAVNTSLAYTIDNTATIERVNTMEIDTKTAFELLEKYQNATDFVVLDVRDKGEFDSGHLPGALLLPVSQDDFSEQLNTLNKDATYLVYCRSGGRSRGAVSMMEKLGFKKIYMLAGGMIAWEGENFPVER